MSNQGPHPSVPAADPAAAGDPARSRRGHRRTRRKALIAVMVSLIFLAGIGTAATVGISRVYDRLTEGTADFEGPPTGEQTVQITAGSSIRAIGRTLAEKGVVLTEGAFVAAARDDSRAATLQPGFYRMQLNMPAAEALALMLDPSTRILARIVIPEGWTVERTISKLARDSLLARADFDKVLAKPKQLALPKWADRNLEGFLFPATYDIEPDSTAESIINQMLERFDQAMVDTDLVARAALVGRTPYEVLTIASLIEKEARLAEDRPKVARVIYNRLDKGMELQLDSTVHYAVGGSEVITTTAEERATDSPYNTYLYPGLPKGPIASPGEAAIEAALSPADGDWLYFVTVDPDSGRTKFATTYAQHQRNVEEFRAWLRANG